MGIRDFLRKQVRIAREEGAHTALRRGGSEIVLKGLAPIARRRARPIWAAEWDVCLVLDACRYDIWNEVAWQHPELCPRGSRAAPSAWSVGSASPEWIAHTFDDRHRDAWADAGYVTANPFSGKDPDDVPFVGGEAYPLADRGLAYLDEVWRDQWPASDNLPTVAPDVLTDRALWAWQRREEYGMDRLVVHYMQPHIPFRSRPEWCAGWDLNGFGTGGGYGEKDDWKMVRDGDVDADEFWTAYADNLRWVLGEVLRWYQATDARLLVTSDHGNAMGEFGEWSHPANSANPVLRRVPWITVDGVNATDVTPEPAGDPPVQRGTSEDVEDQLRALGYMEADAD